MLHERAPTRKALRRVPTNAARRRLRRQNSDDSTEVAPKPRKTLQQQQTQAAAMIALCAPVQSTFQLLKKQMKQPKVKAKLSRDYINTFGDISTKIESIYNLWHRAHSATKVDTKLMRKLTVHKTQVGRIMLWNS